MNFYFISNAPCTLTQYRGSLSYPQEIKTPYGDAYAWAGVNSGQAPGASLNEGYTLRAEPVTGYEFAGWYTKQSKSDSATLSNATILITESTEITLEQVQSATEIPGNSSLKFVVTKYIAKPTVTFVDWNGAVISTQTVSQGGSATPPADPTRNGCTFTGWSGSYQNVTASCTVTATYSYNTYTVTLDAKGGTINSGNVTTYTFNTGASLPTDVAKTGHDFLGWFTSESAQYPVDAIARSDFGDKSFVAKWSASEYSVTLVTNGGSVRSGNVASYSYGVGATLPTNVVRSGYEFAGWYADSAFSGDPVQSISSDATGDKTFYAKWLQIFTVTFRDRNGVVLKTEEVREGGSATAPDAPEVEGYTFAGWSSSFANVTSNVTADATYEQIRLTVVFKDFGVVVKTQQVDFGADATPPTLDGHDGYTFSRWSRPYTDVREDIEVVAVYEGEFKYKVRGKRWQRLYEAMNKTPVYAASSDASLVANTLCDIPWTATDGNYAACLPAHSGAEETDAANVLARKYFDAAAFCAEHENGMHRVYAQATCYRITLPESAVEKRLKSITLVAAGDPYLRDGARISALTNDTGVIPTDCSTCRNGDVRLEGVLRRTTSADGKSWLPTSDRLTLTPTNGMTLGTHLFVFVLLENYAYSRGDYIEGAACIQPVIELGLSESVDEWDEQDVNNCYGDQSNAYAVCRGGILSKLSGVVSGVQSIQLQRSGDPLNGTALASVSDEQGCFGLRTAYAAFYERRLTPVANSTALLSGDRAGAGFVVRGDQVAVGGTSVKTWQLTTAALFVPFAVPVVFRADKVLLDWTGWTGTSTAGGKFNVWLKRGSYVTEYPEDILKNPAIYDATAKNVEGYELLGTIDATQAAKTATFVLDDPLGGYVATVLLTAFVSLDSLNPSSSMTLPQGVATEMNVNLSGSTASGMSTGWKPDITLLG